MVAPDINSGTIQLPEQQLVDSVAYNFTVRLDPDTSNLVTTLTVGNVTSSLSKTVINCAEVGSKTSLTSIIIHISDSDGNQSLDVYVYSD